MTITTPSGYQVTFKGQDELTYGDRRAIQRAMMSGMSIKAGAKQEDIAITGDMVFSGQDEALKVILKSIIRPDGSQVTGNLYDEVMSWKNQKDGDAVFEVVNKSLNEGDEKKELSSQSVA